jgi:DNA-directed RNA polymerase specialized sigma24 family protein
MTDRERAIESIERTMQASVALRKHLLEGERSGRRMISALKRGVPIPDSVAAAGSSAAELRRSTNDLLNDYEGARHEMRTAFILSSVEGGMSIGEIGRVLGVSRQLASRLVREARETLAAVGS